MCHSQHVLGKLQPSPSSAPAQQFIFGNIRLSGKQFDQFIAWKAKRKSPSIVPPWEEASGRVVIYSGLVSPQGWGFPSWCFRDQGHAHSTAPFAPQRGAPIWELNHSSHPCVLQGEGNKQLEKKTAGKKTHCPGRELQRKKGEVFALSAQEQSSCGHCRLFILEGFSEVKHRKFPLNCTTRTCCSKIKASTLKLPPQRRGCRRAGHKPPFHFL